MLLPVLHLLELRLVLVLRRPPEDPGCRLEHEAHGGLHVALVPREVSRVSAAPTHALMLPALPCRPAASATARSA